LPLFLRDIVRPSCTDAISESEEGRVLALRYDVPNSGESLRKANARLRRYCRCLAEGSLKELVAEQLGFGLGKEWHSEGMEVGQNRLKRRK